MKLFDLLDLETIWESLKTPIRQALLAGYSFLLNQIFVFIAEKFGFEFTPEQKLQLISYGTPIAWAIISFIDKVLHQLGKKTGSLKLTYGLTPYLEKIKQA